MSSDSSSNGDSLPPTSSSSVTVEESHEQETLQPKHSADIGSMWSEFLKATVPDIPSEPYCDLTGTSGEASAEDVDEEKMTNNNGKDNGALKLTNESARKSNESGGTPVLVARTEEYRSHHDRQISKKLLNEMCAEFDRLEFESLVDIDDHHH